MTEAHVVLFACSILGMGDVESVLAAYNMVASTATKVNWLQRLSQSGVAWFWMLYQPHEIWASSQAYSGVG